MQVKFTDFMVYTFWGCKQFKHFTIRHLTKNKRRIL